MKRQNKAQSFIIYALLLAVAAAALISMRTFLVRKFQQKFRESADMLGAGEQFEAGRTRVRSLE